MTVHALVSSVVVTWLSAAHLLCDSARVGIKCGGYLALSGSPVVVSTTGNSC